MNFRSTSNSKGFNIHFDNTNGNEKLKIRLDDTDNANTPTEVMTVDSSGNVGIGITAPKGVLEVKNNVRETGFGTVSWNPTLIVNGGNPNAGTNSSSIFLNTNSSPPGNLSRMYYGFNIQGNGTVGGHNNFSIKQYYSQMTAPVTRFHIDYQGKVGIGTTSPNSNCKLHVKSGSLSGQQFGKFVPSLNYIAQENHTILTEAADENWIGIYSGCDSPSGLRFNYCQNMQAAAIKSSGGSIELQSAGAGNSYEVINKNQTSNSAYYAETALACLGGNQHVKCMSSLYINGDSQITSDDRFKHNETLIENGLTIINKLIPVKYFKTKKMYDANHNFDLDASGNPLDESGNKVNMEMSKIWEDSGFIAQRVREIEELKHLVSGEEYDKSGNPEPIFLNYQGIIPYNTKAIQELNESLKELNESQMSMSINVTLAEVKISSTEEKLAAAETKLAAAEAEIANLKTQLATVLARLDAIESN